jgi:predicted NBD/HSP70 family sugar kinase/predicted DNA-binding transcriptional regulator
VRAADAPLKPIEEIPLRSRGTTQTGVRLYNERLVLSLIRFHKQLPKAEIARLTGLSAQTVSVIVRQLEGDGLVSRGKLQKGKVGQPLQPFSLNPDGAFAIGLKVGRRSAELVLLGLDGQVRDSSNCTYDYPEPHEIMRFARAACEIFQAGLGSRLRQRIAGLGVAAPFEIWKWQEETGAPADVMESWKQFDLRGELEDAYAWPVMLCNDATAACAAELFFGKGRDLRNYAYIYVGYFVGGGVVIDGRLYQGPNGNAGAAGSIPVPRPDGGSEQLIGAASLYLLENRMAAAGIDPKLMWTSPTDWSAAAKTVEQWIKPAAQSLAFAAASLASTLDCSAVVIDGAMPTDVRDKLATETRLALSRVNLDGISAFTIEAGSIGIAARALGAASLPLTANFMIDRDVLFQEIT